MIYSNACSYAIRAVCRLSLLRPDGYVLLDELCDGTDLPCHFVAKIFQELVRKGLLTSAKGRGGGFALTKKPEHITLLDIVDLVDGSDELDHCVVGMACCDDRQPCPQHDQWKNIRRQLKSFMQDTTLAAMTKSLAKKLEITGQPIPSPQSKSKPVRGR